MSEIQKVLLVGVGGAIGSILRYCVYRLPVHSTYNFPYQTLTVNIFGCFFVGLLNVIFPAGEEYLTQRLLLVTGLLGGFTTFSAFGLETFQLISVGSNLAAFSYAASSLIVGLIGVVSGAAVASWIK